MKQRVARVNVGTPPTTVTGRYRFTALARAVLRLRFGGPVPRGRAEVARLLGVSVAGVRRVEERVLRQLRMTAMAGATDPPAEVLTTARAAGSPASDDELRSILSDLAQNEWDEM